MDPSWILQLILLIVGGSIHYFISGERGGRLHKFKNMVLIILPLMRDITSYKSYMRQAVMQLIYSNTSMNKSHRSRSPE
jgi:hypothetical protein